MLFDITHKICSPGDKVTITHGGQTFEIECVESTVIEFERRYLMKFQDGSVRYMLAGELLTQSN